MSSIWGNKLKVSVFGESHGSAIGVTIDGFPPGFQVDFNAVEAELKRRAPGQNETSTARREADEFETISGLFNGLTTGAPLTAICRNTDTRSRDYKPDIPRPSHADLAAIEKYGGFSDYRGGGHFSGRLTAPIVFTGAIAKQILRSKYGIEIISRIVEIRGETDPERQRETILTAKSNGDSVGGIIECVVNNPPKSLGEPMFDGVESVISSILFSIPAVKGVEFGDGFEFAKKFGSEVSDGLYYDSGEVKYFANHNGGINGGITNGEPIIFRVALKPTPTISTPQSTVDLSSGENVTYSFHGRHDPCVVPRAVPVAECAAAIAILDLILGGK
ncbi:MAG: chorismate synthase [Oscillospiraceae bacterium]|jgi:chorismate synthase|nr:chorismate synthase [Oscillospiraceae bacterium]